jgi:hypothetical protein
MEKCIIQNDEQKMMAWFFLGDAGIFMDFKNFNPIFLENFIEEIEEIMK